MNGRDFLPDNPRIHHVCPLLEHVFALIRILCFVVDGPDAFLFMGQAFLNPVGIKSHSIISGTVEPAWILGSRRKALANTVTNTVSRAMLSIHAGFRAISKKRALNYY